MEFRAQHYGVSTSRLNQQVNRNIARFPEAFRFQLSKEERDKVIANCNNLQSLKFNPTLPYVISNAAVFQGLENIERHQIATDQRIDHVFQMLEAGQHPQQGPIASYY